MAETLLSLPLPKRLPADVEGTEGGGGRRLRVSFIGERGEQVGDSVELDVPAPTLVEVRGELGRLEWREAEPPLTLSYDVPDAAAGVRLERSGGALFFPLGDVSARAPRPPDSRRSYPSPGARWRLAVVSERFADEQGFFDHCRALHEFIEGEKPFSEDGISFGVEALFWQSDPVAGLFGATDSQLASGRVLAGNGDLVNRFVAEAQVDPQKVLVLVNSSLRAGAGGFGRTRPSWTTNKALSPETWERIALHELGHAFGLADEYEDPYNLGEPNPLEPNVSKERDPRQTSWRDFVTVAAPPVPSAGLGQVGTYRRDDVGTFCGARYRDDRFRPSPTCRMRYTTSPFCPVCQAVIRRELQA